MQDAVATDQIQAENVMNRRYGRYGSNQWKILLYRAGAAILVLGAASGAAYGAYAYVRPQIDSYQKEKEEKQKAQDLLDEVQIAVDQKAAADQEAEAAKTEAEKARKEAEEAKKEAEEAKKEAQDAKKKAKKQKKQQETVKDVEQTKDTERAAEYQVIQADSSNIEDYGAVLNPDLYQYYDSGISDFAFYYPAELYNEVSCNEEPVEKDYGMNMQTIRFTASAGSELVFTLYRRTDYRSIEQMTDYIYGQETASMRDASRLVLSAEEDYGRVIVTGYTDAGSRLVYDMVKIEPSYVLHMKLYFPQYTGAQDQLQKGYVTECVYRMCEFSGSSKPPRSYEEFTKGS